MHTYPVSLLRHALRGRQQLFVLVALVAEAGATTAPITSVDAWAAGVTGRLGRSTASGEVGDFQPTPVRTGLGALVDPPEPDRPQPIAEQ